MMASRITLLLATAAAALHGVRADPTYSPIVNPNATARCDAHTRFSILTPRIIRAEFRANITDAFEDRASLVFINRLLPVVPKFEVANATTWCNITVYDEVGTVSIQLAFNKAAATTTADGGAASDYFIAHDLQATGGPATAPWRYAAGQNVSAGNLNGTLGPTRSTDLQGCCQKCADATAGNCDPRYDLQPGLLSRGGWALIDDGADTRSPLLTLPADAGATGEGGLETYFRRSWLAAAPGAEPARRAGAIDRYLIACGSTNYRPCLNDYTQLTGPIAFPPMNALGVWWSRHWGDETDNKPMVDAIGPMTEHNIQTMVLDGYASRDLPLHVLVADMEWHEQMQPPACTTFVGHGVYGGYTWNTTLFADPAKFVASLHANGSNARGPLGIRLALNYHAYGKHIDNCQAGYAAMAAVLGAPANGTASLPDLEDGDDQQNKTYVDAYMKYLLLPTLADYAWSDSAGVTTWSNDLYVRYKEQEGVPPGANATQKKRGKRGVNFSRYGGRGNHRTPIGFSGDSLRVWETLQYEVFMTPRASNVGFGWWSHDIGGFSGGVIDTQWHTEPPELFLRWLQFAAFAPIFRTHCRYCDQRIWTWSQYDAQTGLAGVGWYPLMRAAMRLRNALVPYIYTHALLRTHKFGESLLTPLYWEPAAAALPGGEAYAPVAQTAYYFGRDLVVAPITAACNATGGGCAPVSKQVWLPPTGVDEEERTWVAWRTWESVGASVLLPPRSYSLADGAPAFAKAGAVLPTRSMASAYAAVADPLIWVVVPHAEAGSGSLYEDDGDSVGYRYGEGVLTWLDFEWTGGAAAAPGSTWRATVNGRNNTAAFPGFDGMPRTRAQRVALKGVRTLPASASCGGAALARTAPGRAPGFWLEPDADPSLDPSGDAGKSLVLACAPTPFAGVSNATLVIEATWANATEVEAPSGAPVIALQLDTTKGPRFPGENPSKFWTAAPMTDQNLESNRSHGWLVSTASLEQSGDLALLGWTPPNDAQKTYPLTDTLSTVRLLGGWKGRSDGWPDIAYLDAEGRLAFRWDALFDRLDGLVNNSIAPLVVLDNVDYAFVANKSSQGVYGQNMAPDNSSFYANGFLRPMMRQLAARYGDRVKTWSFRVGTEPNTYPGPSNFCGALFQIERRCIAQLRPGCSFLLIAVS